MWKPGRWMTIISCTLFTLRLTVLLNSIKCFVISLVHTYWHGCLMGTLMVQPAKLHWLQQPIVWVNLLSLWTWKPKPVCVYSDVLLTRMLMQRPPHCAQAIFSRHRTFFQAAVLSHGASQTIGQQCQLALFHVSFEPLLYKEVICRWQHLQQ